MNCHTHANSKGVIQYYFDHGVSLKQSHPRLAASFRQYFSNSHTSRRASSRSLVSCSTCRMTGRRVDESHLRVSSSICLIRSLMVFPLYATLRYLLIVAARRWFQHMLQIKSLLHQSECLFFLIDSVVHTPDRHLSCIAHFREILLDCSSFDECFAVSASISFFRDLLTDTEWFADGEIVLYYCCTFAFCF